MLVYSSFLLIAAYLILTGIFYYFWLKITVYKKETTTTTEGTTMLSVLIAIRNESGKIELLLKDLEKQSYPKERFELLIMDDHSEDNSFHIVKDFIGKNKLQLQIIKMEEGVTGKKNAITEGVERAKGTLMITTDGDCRMGPEWLSSIERFYREKKKKMITGGVCFTEGDSWREQMMELEFASLVGSGAASLEMGYPSMCNGANLAYEKEVFLEVGGYSNSDHIASGDDEFLMHKIFRKYPGSVSFLKNKAAIVETKAPESWKLFFEQRKRWASKWENYTYTHVKLLALLIFGSNLALVINFMLAPMESYPLRLFLILLTFKFMLEFLFLRSVLVYFGRKLHIGVFLLTEIFYPFYVVLFALIGRTGKYKWKDRYISK
jgi:cellulose synthase/poly-beta-1,6-N-acetylglucosamine synthase-like glycosyltransferase